MRITGGEYKNRKLFVPEGHDVRPTSDRMRQTLFNLLHHAKWADAFEIENAKVLDMYCGSGALGLEALSHGAKHATFVDADTASIKKNAEFLSGQTYTIIKSKGPVFSGVSGCFDLVFMDPPYMKGLIEPTVENLIAKDMLSEGAIVIIEAEKNLKLDLPMKLLDKRTQSQSNLHVYLYVRAVNEGQ